MTALRVLSIGCYAIAVFVVVSTEREKGHSGPSKDTASPSDNGQGISRGRTADYQAANSGGAAETVVAEHAENQAIDNSGTAAVDKGDADYTGFSHSQIVNGGGINVNNVWRRRGIGGNQGDRHPSRRFDGGIGRRGNNGGNRGGQTRNNSPMEDDNLSSEEDAVERRGNRGRNRGDRSRSNSGTNRGGGIGGAVVGVGRSRNRKGNGNNGGNRGGQTRNNSSMEDDNLSPEEDAVERRGNRGRNRRDTWWNTRRGGMRIVGVGRHRDGNMVAKEGEVMALEERGKSNGNGVSDK